MRAIVPASFTSICSETGYNSTDLPPPQSVSARHGGKHYEASVEPLLLKLPANLDQLVVTVHFHGHYGEPSLAIQYLVSSGARVYQMGYDVIGRTWTVE